jgi:hypothetical protein
MWVRTRTGAPNAFRAAAGCASVTDNAAQATNNAAARAAKRGAFSSRCDIDHGRRDRARCNANDCQISELEGAEARQKAKRPRW